jgi:anti-sigma factor RsiW
MMRVICEKCVDLAMDYLEGKLDARTLEALEDHLDDCAPCAAFLRTYKKTGEICREKLQAVMPEELSRQLNAFLKKKIPGFKA